MVAWVLHALIVFAYQLSCIYVLPKQDFAQASLSPSGSSSALA